MEKAKQALIGNVYDQKFVYTIRPDLDDKKESIKKDIEMEVELKGRYPKRIKKERPVIEGYGGGRQ